MKAIVDQIYQHYKSPTMIYRVRAIALHSESLEEMVVYETLYDNPRRKIWVRPRAMFEEKVLIEGQWRERFTQIVDQENQKTR